MVVAASHAAAQFGQFTPLGDFAGGTIHSSAYALSGDGSVVVGGSNAAVGLQAFRWTAALGLQSIGDLPGGSALGRAYGVSADGSKVAGYSNGANGNEAFLWDAASGMVGLGDLSGGNTSSYAYAISGDGGTVVGASSSTVSTAQWVEAFIWTQINPMQPLGVLPGGAPESLAFAVNYDGSVVAGRSGSRAFRWTAQSGMTDLGGVVGGSGSGEAWAISADGAVIVGFGAAATGTEAFRWTQATGAVGLGDLPGGAHDSRALGVSDDGDVIVGHGNYNNGLSEAFLWTPALGMVDLRAHLMSLGIPGLAGWSLRRAEAVSGDGRTIAGWGVNPLGNTEAFVVSLGSPAPTSFCTAGTTTNACAATMSWSGVPSAAASSGFTLHVAGVEGQKQGLIFYGVDNSGYTPLAWGATSSFLCVKPPTQRTPVQTSGGSNNQCDGAFSIDWNAFVAGSPGVLGAPFQLGDAVYAQAWFRDPPSPKTTNLSDALQFFVAP